MGKELLETKRVNQTARRKVFRYAGSLFRLVNRGLFFIFLFNVVFIPNDTFNLKIVSLGVLLLLNFPKIILSPASTERTIALVGGGITAYTIFKSILLTGEVYENIRIGYPGFILLLLPTIFYNKIEFRKVFIIILRLLALFAVVMSLLDLLHIVDMYENPILIWFKDSSNAMIGRGPHVPFYYCIFFKTSPLLYVCLVDSFNKENPFWVLISALALVISGTRANVIMLVFTVVVYLCFLQSKKKHRRFAIYTLLLFTVVLLIDGRTVDFIIDVFQRKASSDSTRDGHLQGVLEVWIKSPWKFIFGSGYSAEFYSYGLNAYTSNIELSYWNLLRQVGAFPFFLMMFGCIYPALRLIERRREYGFLLAYFSYMVVAYSNPFLYSSTGLTIILFIYYVSIVKPKRQFLRKELRKS